MENQESILHPFDLLEQNISSHTDNTFVGDDKGVLSRRESRIIINCISNAIEKCLGENNNNAGIAIHLPRNRMYLLSMFAAWQAGHYFIPLNVKWPEDHLHSILKKASPNIVISEKAIDGYNCLILKSMEQADTVSDIQREKWRQRRQKPALVYTIFTSGSTGEQKGVMISSSAYMSYVDWVSSYFAAHKTTRALLITAELTFDITLGDIAYCLAHVVEIHVSPDPRHMAWHAKLILDRHIDVFYSVPSTITRLFSWVKERGEAFPDLRLVVSGGDSFSTDLIDLVKQTASSSEFHNVYGPTECTINCVATRVDNLLARIKQNHNLVPIGLPFPHLDTLLLADDGRPDEKSGELLVSGAQCMDGYIRDEKLTKKAFMTIDGRRYYSTGDLVRKDDDGYCFILSRIDNLVKVKGYRINPTEVDNVLLDDERIKEVKTIVFKEHESPKQIITYFVPFEKFSNVKCEAEKICKAKLPKYMVPHEFIESQTLPLGSSGKYDTKQLRKTYLDSI
jgi:D-alanine--poly(phosphoribitol) ligase subunit 1